MYNIDTDSPVLVTGGTGYVAGWLIKGLLEAGVTVHAAVRDPSNTQKHEHLDKIAQNAPGNIKYFKADLLDEGSFAEAMEGCSIVFHTASPFTSNFKDAQKDLVDPAKLGTRNVLTQATKTPSVKRVVVTSSCAAIYGDNKDVQNAPNGILTEEIWNTSSSLTHQPYSYSKTEAEREAWNIAESQNQWDLVTINPSLVMGAGLNPNGTSESFNMIRQMGDGSLKNGAPDFSIGMVDVRDVAKAHIAAAYTAEAKGRYITSAHNSSLLQMAQTLIPKYGNDYPIPRKKLPKFLLWLIGPMVNKAITRQFVSNNIGIAWKADNSKIVNELGINFRPEAETINDFFQQMIDTGQFDKK